MKAKSVLEEKQGKQAIQFTLQRAMNQIIDRHEELCVEGSENEQEIIECFARGDYKEALKDELTRID